MTDPATTIRKALDYLPDGQFLGARHQALAALTELEAENRLLREEIRIREESQIPMVPRAAQERLEAAERERDQLAAYVAQLEERLARAALDRHTQP